MSSKIPVSVVVMTKNNAANIGKCLASLTDFAEVFVVDSNSTDGTQKIADGFGAKIVNFTWDGHYPKKKQWCLSNLPFYFDWVLYVDADEEMRPELGAEIHASMLNHADNIKGYFIGFDYFFMGKALKHGHRVYKLALMNRYSSRFIDCDDLGVENMGEVEGHYQPYVEGKTKLLRYRMLHRDHENLFHFISRHNRYSDWEAYLRYHGKLRNANESRLAFRKTLQWIGDRMPFRGGVIFIYTYIVRLGFLDGRAGFSWGIALMIYYAMINLKINELKLKEKR